MPANLFSCSHRRSQDAQRYRGCARGREPGQPRTPTLQLQIDTVPPDLSRGELSVRPSSCIVKNHCTLFNDSLACCVSVISTPSLSRLLPFNEKGLRVDFFFFQFLFSKEEHRTICDFTLVLKDLLCHYGNGQRCSEIVNPAILLLLKRGNAEIYCM